MRLLKGNGRDSKQSQLSGDRAAGATHTLSIDVRPRGIRVGIVGCGYWGSKHARVLSATAGVSEIALIECDQALCRRLQRVFPAARSFRSLQAALPHVDALVIATPRKRTPSSRWRQFGKVSMCWSRSRWQLP